MQINSFREKAFYLFVWRTCLVALVSIVLMVTRSAELASALVIGGNGALLFSIALVVFAGWLNHDRIVFIEPWRVMDHFELPAGPAGRRWASNCLREVALQFAKAASAVAAVLLGSALLLTSE